jgi:FMN-dependent NADH-azoreductase
MLVYTNIFENEASTMATLLVIESSPRSSSISSSLTGEYVTGWQAKHPGGTILRHNVATQPVPFVSEAWIGAAYTPVEQRTPEQREALAVSDRLIGEIEAADTIVIAAPMHNFSISAPLKAWLDQIVRVGRSFSYGPEGPKGLLDSAKQVIVVTARGGAYAGNSPYAFLDQQEPYLRTVLGFIGLTNVQFVHAENQSRGAELAQLGVQTGSEALLALV